MELTKEQLVWLESRGGRTPSDVVIYKNTPCVEMWDGFHKQGILVEVPEPHQVKNTIHGIGMYYHMLKRFQ